MKLLNENSRAVQFLTRALLPVEKISKEAIFDCRMCGQCILHSTGMTCPMRCPKNLRNGPCGGVRANGNCEVFPDKPCVWVLGINRAPRIPIWHDAELGHLQPPVNWKLQGASSWVNLLTGADKIHPKGWNQSNYKEHEHSHRTASVVVQVVHKE